MSFIPDIRLQYLDMQITTIVDACLSFRDVLQPSILRLSEVIASSHNLPVEGQFFICRIESMVVSRKEEKLAPIFHQFLD